MNDKGYWIAFNKVRGIGPARLTALIKECGSIVDAWHAPLRKLQSAGLDRRSLESLIAAQGQIDPDQELARVEREGITVLTWDDARYPVNLRNIDAPPPTLYVRDEIIDADIWSVAVVGTRRASAYGREVAHRLATELATAGVTVVSGLALGIDTVAHQAALEAGGRTLAVLGSGLDHIYPQQNRKLAQQIAERGAVISEYALGVRPEAANFPPRNRVISGLSKGVVVVEAGDRSGALITAKFAAEQGKDVFAVPGSILHPGSSGCNRLIQDGAIPMLSVDDVLDHLDLDRVHAQQTARQLILPDPLEEQLLVHVGPEPRHVDDIVRRTDMPPPQVSSLLTMMELKGLVRQVGAMNYVRV